jgi:ABC-2 type transport system ATP-binding protein
MDPRLNHYDFTYLIGVVMGQKSSLVWDVPVRESLRLFADIYELSRPEFDARVEELDPVLGLNEIMAQPVRKLSLGQRMRAEIAASLLHRPRVIFLDEPTIGLDVVTQERVREFLRRANREEDVTILLTTHNLSDVEELCTRAILIDRGRVVYDGTLDYLRKLDPYRTLEVEFAGPTSPALIRHLEEAGAPPEVDAIGSGRLRITLEAEKLPAIVSQCLEELRVSDISVKGPSLSSVLRRVYEGDVSLAATGQVEPITGPGVDDEGAGL